MNSLQLADLSNCYYKHEGFYYAINNIHSYMYYFIKTALEKDLDNDTLKNIYKFKRVSLPEFYFPETNDFEVAILYKSIFGQHLKEYNLDLQNLAISWCGFYYDMDKVDVYILKHAYKNTFLKQQPYVKSSMVSSSNNF